MAEKLSKRTLDAALRGADPNRDTLLYDPAFPGLAARLRRGRAGFVFRYEVRGRSRQVTLGAYGPMTLDQARDLARDLWLETRRGGDPAESRRAARVRGTTFADVAELYLADLEERATMGAKRGKPSTAAEFRRLLTSRVLPRLGRVEVVALDLTHVEAMHRELSSTPAQANRALTVTSAVLTFAERRRLRPIGSNPCRLVARFREQPAQSRLSLAEVERLGGALRDAESTEGENPSALLAVRLLALTGLRRSEVLGHVSKKRRTAASGLVWGDVDEDAKSLYLRDAKAGARSVPLGSAAVALLRLARPADGAPTDPVCPGEVPGQPYIGIDKVQRRLLRAAGVAGASLHSLRRTFASVAADAGLGEYVVGALLGHARQGVTGRYVIPGTDPLRQAAELICSTIAAALDGRKPADVVQLEQRRA